MYVYSKKKKRFKWTDEVVIYQATVVAAEADAQEALPPPF